MATTNEPALTISPIASTHLSVPIIGTSPLICHNWSAKARQMMLDAQQGRKSPKVARDPEADYQGSFYRTKDGYGVPAAAFKKATVSAARFYGKDVTMTALKQFLWFTGIYSPNDPQALVVLEGEPHMREDVVGLPNRGTDLRFRAEFPEWSTRIEVTFPTSSLTKESVLSLIDAGGLGVGICEWRPEKSGDFGRYRIDPTREVEIS